MSKKLDIPQYLDHRQWDKNKGVIAKVLKKKTGITEALKDFYNVYQMEYGWGRVDEPSMAGYIKRAGDPKTEPMWKEIGLRELTLGLQECQAKEAFLGKLQKKLDVVKQLADKYKKEFHDSKVIPSSSRIFLENMSKSCTTFVGDVRRQITDTEKKLSEALQKAKRV